jgi:hypothetical protein
MALSEVDWLALLDSINNNQCTPFIGPEVCKPYLPTDKDIAKDWAKCHKYPLDDSSQLSRVAQYLTITKKSLPKISLRDILELQNLPNFNSREHKDSPYSVLARLNLPIYITTNYDKLMQICLKDSGKEPHSEFCIWNDWLRDYVKNVEFPTALNKTYKPTVDNPIVYHLNGIVTFPESMVLTEKDYFDFLIYLSREGDQVFPSVIRTDLARNTYLFIGYRLEDTSFLAMFVGITTAIKRLEKRGEVGSSIAVQFNSSINQSNRKEIEEYLNEYTNDLFNIRVHLGDPFEFSKELNQRWEKYKNTLDESKNRLLKNYPISGW